MTFSTATFETLFLKIIAMEDSEEQEGTTKVKDTNIVIQDIRNILNLRHQFIQSFIFRALLGFSLGNKLKPSYRLIKLRYLKPNGYTQISIHEIN